MLENEKINPPLSQNFSILPVSDKCFNSSVEVLNAVIIELRKTEIDIQKISFFENPLEAIIYINKPERRRTRFSWSQILRSSKRKHLSTIRLKLNVLQMSNAQNPFLLKYEILPTSA